MALNRIKSPPLTFPRSCWENVEATKERSLDLCFKGYSYEVLKEVVEELNITEARQRVMGLRK